MVAFEGETRILLVGDDSSVREALTATVAADDGAVVQTADTRTEAVAALEDPGADCLVDGRVGAGERIPFLAAVREAAPDLPALFVTDDPGLAEEALGAGATDVVVRHDDSSGRRLVEHRLGKLLERETQKRHEQRLAAEREATDRLLDTIDDIFYVLDTEGTLQQWNESLTRVTGYTDQEIDGMDALAFFPAEHQDRIADAIREAIETGSTTVEAEMATTDGERIPVEFTGARVVDDDDRPRGVVGVGRDITDREERIEKLDQLRRHVSDVVWMSDPGKDSMDFISDSYEDVWGRTPESLRESPMSFVDAIHPDDRERVRGALADQQRNPDDYEETYRVVQPDGEVRWVHDRASGVYEDGTLTRIVGIASDITERKHREQELEVKNRAMDEAPIGITIHDATAENAPITYANDGFVQLTGYDHDTVDGATVDLFAGAETDETRLRELRRAVDGGEDASVVVLLYRKDGTPFWARVSLASVADDAGDATHFVGFLQDVTEIKENEQEISRRLNEFGEVLAEDLRTPLQSATEELRRAMATGDDADVEAAMRSLERVDKLVDDLTTVHASSVKSRETVESSPVDGGGQQ